VTWEGKYTKSQGAVTAEGSAWRRYRQVVLGGGSLCFAFRFELAMLFKNLPGAPGLLLRKLFWPGLFGKCGRGVQFGEGIVLRHPRRIALGDRVVLTDWCVLDARNEVAETAITLDDDVICSNGVSLVCKGGTISIGARTGIGKDGIVHSVGDSGVTVGADVIVGPRCFFAGGTNYRTDRLDVPIRLQGNIEDGGVVIEDDVWLGANVTVLGGATVATGAVIAAGAIVTKSIPPRAIAMGQPAKVVRTRGEGPAGQS
jgi:galactoside O-acetyltransferase